MSTPYIPWDTPLVATLERFRVIGFDVDFTPRPGPALECGECGSKSAAGQVRLEAIGRLEGASDPDDSLAILAITCPVCGRSGTAVVHFGPASSAEDLDLLEALQPPRAQPPAR